MSQQLVERIKELKKQRNAVILVHNYQPDEVQDIADVLGDSLDLSRKAAATDADVIVFCGVHFMAETAAILSPQKTVLLPELSAGCPMAQMITAPQLRELKAKNPGAAVVTYINSTAEVKAETDVCCTSANARRVVESLGDRPVIFVPDQNLGSYVSRVTGREMIFWPGFCPIHARILPEHIAAARQKYPDAEVLVHPECLPAVTAMADQVLSTTGMCRHAASSSARRMIVGTETGIIHRMRLENPDKEFYPVLETAVCENMKKNSLEKVLWALENMQHRVTVPENIRVKALEAINRMLAL